MARIAQEYEADGFYGIGILNNQDAVNLGTLWRSAFILGASFIFTIDKKYKRQSSDVTKAWSKIPLYNYATFEDFYQHLPYSTQLIGVELTEEASPLHEFQHPARAVYLLGSENAGIPDHILSRCHSVLSLPGHFSLNVSVTGSIICHDRVSKIATPLPQRR